MMPNALIPFVVEKSSEGERSYDIYSRLLEDRIIFLGEEIDSELANRTIAQLLLLDQKNPTADIYIYINSPGGSVTSGLAIYDTIQFVRPQVRTVCVGLAASMAAVLLAAGSPGKRSALPNSRIMIHQPRTYNSPGVQTVTEQEIDVGLSKAMKKQLAKILAKHTGKTEKQILKDGENDCWFDSLEAKVYGLIDEILEHK